jgi:hypothetical protein
MAMFNSYVKLTEGNHFMGEIHDFSDKSSDGRCMALWNSTSHALDILTSSGLGYAMLLCLHQTISAGVY